MDEIKQMDLMATGIEKFNYAAFGTGSDDRTRTEYSWGDFFMNLNDAPFNTDMAMIVTGWSGHLGWMKATLSSYRRTGGFVILAFDNSNYIWDPHLNEPMYVIEKQPRSLHTLLAHAVVQKHKTYDADKRIGWFWNVKYALSIINAYPNIKYVYCTNADCIVERPEGMRDVIKLLEEAQGDFISGQSQPGGTIHTACVMYKVETLNKIIDYMTTRISPMVIAGQSPETMLRDVVNLTGIKEVFAPEQPRLKNGDIDWYCTTNAPSTWKTLLGFRNLYAEQEDRTNNRFELLHRKYLDDYQGWLYFNPTERSMMCKYYDTMDRRWLYMWWDRNCNSCEDRVYHPLEHYGTEPIPEDGKNWA